MSKESVTLESIDEMWKTIETFGIKREVFKMSNPSYQQIRDLYLLIKKSNEPTKALKSSF